MFLFFYKEKMCVGRERIKGKWPQEARQATLNSELLRGRGETSRAHKHRARQTNPNCIQTHRSAWKQTSPQRQERTAEVSIAGRLQTPVHNRMLAKMHMESQQRKRMKMPSAMHNPRLMTQHMRTRMRPSRNENPVAEKCSQTKHAKQRSCANADGCHPYKIKAPCAIAEQENPAPNPCPRHAQGESNKTK